jgi:protein O-GlcNAc transferase
MNPQLISILQQAIQYFQTGNLIDSERLLTQVIRLDPSNPPALQILGLMQASQGNLKEAARFLKKAAKLNSNDPSLMYNLGKVLSDLGDDSEALPFHEKATKLAPNNIDAWLNYSKCLAKVEKFSLALSAIEFVLNNEPNNAMAWNNKGAILKDVGRPADALQSYDIAIRLNPSFAEAFYNKGIALSALEKFSDAINCFNQALELHPNYYAALNNRGVAQSRLMMNEEALKSYNDSLTINPNYTEALINKAVTLTALKKYDESLSILSLIATQQPLNTTALVNQGIVYFELKQLDKALANFEYATSLSPDNVEAWCNKGIALNDLKRFEEAATAYENALKLKPNREFLLGTFLSAKMHICDWGNLTANLQKVNELVEAGQKAIMPFPYLALMNSERLHQKAAEIWVNAKHPMRLELSSPTKRINKDKVRLGYFSADFRNHPVANLIVELFETHDKNKFELIGFSFGVDDQSEMRQRIINSFDHFLDVRNKSDKQVAIVAREMGIDIAIDLTGLTADARTDIFAYRAAPIQINYLGYPGTMGAKYIDYIIADKTIIPEENKKYYTENVLYLPDCYQPNDKKRKISPAIFSRAELGLPNDSFVFCSFNNNYKITPDTFSGWMRILHQAKGSVLWLFEDTAEATLNLIKQAEEHGVDSRRLIFAKRLPLSEHLARYRLADLFLDTLPYNGHTTASDALWVGLPVLTQAGKSFAGRVAASLLHAIDLPELITHSQHEYESLAVELALNPSKLKAIKRKLLENRDSSALFNTELFTKNIEELYLSIL